MKVGQRAFYAYAEFDGQGICECTVISIEGNQVVLEDKSDSRLKYLLDADSENIFMNYSQASHWLEKQKKPIFRGVESDVFS